MTSTTRTLLMDLKVNESVTIDGGMVITVEQKSGQRIKLRFEHQGADIRRLPDRRDDVREATPGRRADDRR
jgi:hypothetical protein